MLKILQARLQQFVNSELPHVQSGFRKGRGTRDQIANICWILEKSREFQENMYFCVIDYAQAYDCVDHNKLLTILKEMGIQETYVEPEETPVNTEEPVTTEAPVEEGGGEAPVDPGNEG